MAIERKTYPKDLDLALDFGHADICVDISSTNELHGDFFTPLHMEAKFDLAELTLP